MNVFGVIILLALIGEYVLSMLSAALSVRALSPVLPSEFEGVLDAERYARSQEYTRVTTWFGVMRGTFNLALIFVVWRIGGFAWLDGVVRGLERGPVVSGLLYIGALGLGSLILGLPFRAYRTFVIEARFGFNRTTPSTFITDTAKGVMLTVVLGGILLAGVLAFLEWAGALAWLWCWIAATAFLLVVQYLAPIVIMPLFNTFSALEADDLREAIMSYAKSVDFSLRDIFVVDGSRRSSKANAFFTGLGRHKRIGLYDTLVEKHTVAELVSIVAHEVGHYKKGHIVRSLALQIGYLGALFFVMSLVLEERGLFDAFYMAETSVYAGLVFFGLLFSPVELGLSLVVNSISRRNEFEADAFAAKTAGGGEPLVSALKKLSADSLSNLTPHPFDVFLHDSHPPVLQRIEALRRAAPSAA